MLSTPSQQEQQEQRQPAIRQAPGKGNDPQYLDVIAAGGDIVEGIRGSSSLPADPSICTFWCAVAVGALVKGCPVESVSGMRARAQNASALTALTGSTAVRIRTTSVEDSRYHVADQPTPE